MDATAEAFARFRAAVAASDDPRDLAPDPLLLSCTRNAVASLAPVPADRPGCAATPFLLIGRYEGLNSAGDDEALSAHVAGCAACTERALAFDRAERAFRAPHPPVPEGVVVARVIAALESAAPILHRDEPDATPAVADAALAVPVAAELDDPDVATADDTTVFAAVGPADDDTMVLPAVAPLGEDVEELDDVAPPYAGETPAVAAADPAVPQADVVRRVVLPAAIVGAGVLAAMGISGVFGGTAPAPARGAEGPPAPTPPERAPIAGEDVQSRAARAARDALRRIERTERRTAREAEALRRRTATEPDPAPPADEPGTTAPAAPRDTPSPAPQSSPAPADPGPSDDGGSDTGAVIEPEQGETSEPPADAPLFEPGTSPTP